MAIQVNSIADLANLTKVPAKVYNELVKKECWCIGSIIHDAVIQKENVAIINVGIGTLSVEIETKQCKFLPSKELKSAIKKSIDEKVDPVEFELNREIVDKLLAITSGVL